MDAVGLIFSIVLAGLFAHASVKAWRSSSDEWRDYVLSRQPKNWRRWWMLTWPLLHLESSPTPYLWQARLLGPLGALLGAFIAVFLARKLLSP